MLAITRLAEDRFEIVFNESRPFKIMQITDTHFGLTSPGHEETDEQTFEMIRALVDQNQPDLVFHTGDFINNDKAHPRMKPALDFMNNLGRPWSLVFGNHDHPKGHPGSVSLDEYYSKLENPVMGFHTSEDGQRNYCFRIDLCQGETVFASIFGFNTGGGETPKVVSEAQIEWFQSQLGSDLTTGVSHPILVMQHIPMIEYRHMFEAGEAIGRCGESVCFEEDRGEVFAVYRGSGRVQSVFCGHDHVNDFIGVHQGIRLAYGRATGWSSYGDWQRGCRMIEVDPVSEASKTRVVLPHGAVDDPEWQVTLIES